MIGKRRAARGPGLYSLILILVRCEKGFISMLQSNGHLFQKSRIFTQFLSRFFSMRFVQFESNGVPTLGVELKDGGDIVDVTKCDSTIPANMRDFIAAGDTAINKASK